MRYSEKQNKLEKEVYEAIDDLADEFNLKVPYYPQVYYLGKSALLEAIQLSHSIKEDVKNVGSCWTGLFVEKPCAIFLSSNSSYREEATHFLHYVNSKKHKSRYKKEDIEFILVLREMLGFFGSLELGDERINPYKKWPDPYSEKNRFQQFIKELKQKTNAEPTMIFDHVIHQQGYSLGERLFYEYEKGNFSKRKIRKFFQNRFKKGDSAKKVFKKLRKKLDWPIKK